MPAKKLLIKKATLPKEPLPKPTPFKSKKEREREKYVYTGKTVIREN